MPAPRAGGLYKINCHWQGQFCRGFPVSRSPGWRGHISFQTELALRIGSTGMAPRDIAAVFHVQHWNS